MGLFCVSGLTKLVFHRRHVSCFLPVALAYSTWGARMAAIWKGSLTFGLVSIPVELKTAVRADHISFRLLHEEDLSPVKYERVCQADGETVPWNEIIKGYEYEKGKFVVLTDADFKTAALEQSKTIDILDFVKQDEIDPATSRLRITSFPQKAARNLTRCFARQSGAPYQSVSERSSSGRRSISSA